MKKKLMLLVALVFILSMALAACGDSENAAPPAKNMAVATISDGEFPIDVKVDVSTGLSVAFYDDGFSLFDGEFDDSTPPLATATILASDEVYEEYYDKYKDSESFSEEYGICQYTSIVDEICYLYKIGEKIPFLISFDKSVDADRAEEIIGCLEFDYDNE